MGVETVGVVGAGQMGSGIAHVAALGGFRVVLTDANPHTAERGRESIARNLKRQQDKGLISAGVGQETLARISLGTEVSQFASCQLVIEAVVEREDVKAAVFRELDGVVSEGAVLASNTSSISITRLAAATGRPDRVIGMHFMNPVPMMELVEVIRGMATSRETFALVESVARRMGKKPVEVNDFPGFVSNRVLMPMINEAIFAVYEGVASAEAVDEVMKLGMRHPMGPLALADLIGLDTCLAILRVLHEGFGDPKYRPCPLLVKMVDAGWLGRKSGRGFYNYNEG